MQTRNTSKKSKNEHGTKELEQVRFEFLFEHSISGGSPDSKRDFVPQWWPKLAERSESILSVAPGDIKTENIHRRSEALSSWNEKGDGIGEVDRRTIIQGLINVQ